MLLGGVATGLGAHLGVDVVLVRAGLVALVVVGGWPGTLVYPAFWVLAPIADQAPGALAPPRAPLEGVREAGYLVSLAALAVGAALVVQRTQLGLPPAVTWPLAVIGFGVVILWRQADDGPQLRWQRATAATRGATAVRAALGLAVVTCGMVLFGVSRGGGADALSLLVAVVVITLGVGLISGPWWLRLVRDRDSERSARIREQERAEVAAHVHDSVLHTLALIQRQVDDPRAVARLARAQERELRGWLYRRTATDPDTDLAAALERVVAEVEDGHDTTIEAVVVGDAPLDDGLRALLAATREALVNAAKYADGAPVSVYAEVEPDRITVFVRDRGPGFDLAAVPADRLGVRQSIIGRMGRHHGAAVVRSSAGEGTEIELGLPRVETAGATG